MKIIVDDACYGISDERQNEVFNLFARLCIASSDKLGLGLGFVKAKLICDFLAIEINYRHKVFGSLFWLDIPMT